MSTKMKIVGNGFADLAEQLDRITNDIKPAVDELSLIHICRYCLAERGRDLRMVERL